MRQKEALLAVFGVMCLVLGLWLISGSPAESPPIPAVEDEVVHSDTPESAEAETAIAPQPSEPAQQNESIAESEPDPGPGQESGLTELLDSAISSMERKASSAEPERRDASEAPVLADKTSGRRALLEALQGAATPEETTITYNREARKKKRPNTKLDVPMMDALPVFDDAPTRPRRSTVRDEVEGGGQLENSSQMLEKAMNLYRAGKMPMAPGGQKRRTRKPPREPMAPAEPIPTVRLDGAENKPAPPPIEARPMVETVAEPISTFAVDVDNGSYTLARARLRQGYLPKEDVRAEEFLNYFRYAYPRPADGAPFAVQLDGAPHPFVPEGGKHLLRVGLQARDMEPDERPPAHITFLIDVSGSMFGRDKLELAREALDLLVRSLNPDDTVAIVTYARGAKVALWPSGAGERDSISSALSELEAGGSTAMDAGLQKAYQLASVHFVAGHINRVVVLSDGRANVGAQNVGWLLRSVRAGAEDGVTLSTIGFGARSFNDKIMEQLADHGNGNYFFIDSYREAQRIFSDRLCGTLQVIAKDVKIQVEFDPTTVQRYRLVGYENRRLTKEQFRDDAVDAGEVGVGHSVTALYELELTPAPGERLGTVRVRHKAPEGKVATEQEFAFRTEELAPELRASPADLQFAASVAMFAELLNDRGRFEPSHLSFIREIAASTAGDDPDRAEFVELVDVAAPYLEAESGAAPQE